MHHNLCVKCGGFLFQNELKFLIMITDPDMQSIQEY